MECGCIFMKYAAFIGNIIGRNLQLQNNPGLVALSSEIRLNIQETSFVKRKKIVVTKWIREKDTINSQIQIGKCSILLDYVFHRDFRKTLFPLWKTSTFCEILPSFYLSNKTDWHLTTGMVVWWYGTGMDSANCI